MWEGEPVPIQVTWDGPTERHPRAWDAIHKAIPRSAEAGFGTAESFGAGLPTLRPTTP